MIIACDFDGTIVTHEYPKIGKPIPFAIQTLKKLQDEDHHQVILWTVHEGALLQEAIDYCAGTRGPVAQISKKAIQCLNSTDQNDIATIERNINTEAEVQGAYLEENCSWITLFIAMAPSLGFLGTVIGMVQAFDDIERAGDISPTVVAGGMKVALITTIFGIIVALVLQVFYNYVLSRVEALNNNMEEAAMGLLEMCVKSPKCQK